MSKLRLVDDEHRLQVFDLTRGGVFGRDPAVDFVVDHPSVSRRHAAFTVHAGEIEVQDLESANGTAVNGRLLDRRPYLLNPGDQLQFGGLIANYHAGEDQNDSTLKHAPVAQGSRTATAVPGNLLEQQMRLGRSVQRRLLVDRPPFIDEYELAHVLLPALGVGGDFIHWGRSADGRYALVIGGVSGKGVPAALYMAFVSGILTEIGPSARDACDLLERANRSLYPIMEPGMCVSALALLIDPKSHQVEQASAGHGPALFKRAVGDVAHSFIDRGQPLGLAAAAEIGTSTIHLDRGDLLCVFTDGVDHATGSPGDPFGRRRALEALVRSAGAADAARRLRSAVGHHLGGVHQQDDITIVTLERRL